MRQLPHASRLLCRSNALHQHRDALREAAPAQPAFAAALACATPASPADPAPAAAAAEARDLRLHSAGPPQPVFACDLPCASQLRPAASVGSPTGAPALYVAPGLPGSKTRALQLCGLAMLGAAGPGADPAPAATRVAAAVPRAHSVATQCVYRESEAQTVPYEPPGEAGAPGAKQQALSRTHHCPGLEVQLGACRIPGPFKRHCQLKGWLWLASSLLTVDDCLP